MNTHTLICNHCQTSYESKYKPKKGKPNYCSRTCSNKATPRRKPTHKCKGCDNLVPARTKFCSTTCKTTHRNSKRQTQEERVKVNKKLVITYRQQLKLKAIEYKGGKCQCCGYNNCPRALEFHHLNPEEKDFHLSRVTRSWDNIVTELDKCVLVCANCHREIHAGVRDVGCTSG